MSSSGRETKSFMPKLVYEYRGKSYSEVNSNFRGKNNGSNGETPPVIDKFLSLLILEFEPFLTKHATLLDFKNALKQIKPTQSVALDQLFSEYGY